MEPLPKKRLGQHFLKDSGVLDRIVRLVRPVPTDLFIEVGAGAGALTVRIAETGARVFAVELDADVVPSLRQATAAFPFVTVVPKDFLTLEMPALVRDELPGRALRAVGNLPYNVATAIIEKCLDSRLPFQDLTFMTQLEVAERIVASPGSKTYGYLSVLCQHIADVRMAFKVSPRSFFPPPKVMSAMVSFRPRPNRLDDRSEQCLLGVARAAFGHRRKMLSNSLRQSPALSQHVPALFAHTGIDPSRRAEQLAVHEYEQLAQVLSELC